MFLGQLCLHLSCVQQVTYQTRNLLVCIPVQFEETYRNTSCIIFVSFWQSSPFLFLIFLRRFSIFCFNNRTGIVLFAFLGIADAGLLSAGGGGSLVWNKLSRDVFV